MALRHWVRGGVLTAAIAVLIVSSGVAERRGRRTRRRCCARGSDHGDRRCFDSRLREPPDPGTDRVEAFRLAQRERAVIALGRQFGDSAR